MQLFDTSVWAWRGNAEVEAWFGPALLAGDLAICEMVALEILSGAPNREWYRRTRELLMALPWVHMAAAEWQRALDVHHLLEEQLGTNARRAVKHTDLLIAAAAEVHGMPLVHYDKDFETIQRVTGQRMSWVAALGSL